MDLPKTELVDTARKVAWSWAQLFIRWGEVAEAARKVGPTSARPVKPYLGQSYLDKSLGTAGKGKPIWAAEVTPAGVTWVDSDGVEV